ncbi:MAG: hypothetical protein QM718_06135 [Steroidobacteraceae bacterium]
MPAAIPAGGPALLPMMLRRLGWSLMWLLAGGVLALAVIDWVNLYRELIRHPALTGGVH